MDLGPVSLNAEDAIVSPVWSILSKGQTGAGKTIFSCGKDFRPVYVFMCEGRFESVINYYKRLDGHAKDIHYNNFTMHDGFYPLDKKMDAIVARPEYKTVVMSSLTSFIRIVLLHLMKASAEKQVDGRTKGVRKKGGIQASILEDYNFEDAAIINELIGFFQQVKSMGINVILEAHITPYDIKTIDEDSGQKDYSTVYEILTKGKKAPAEVPSWFNEVWLFEKRVSSDWNAASGPSQAQYWVNTVGNQTSSCKSSFNIPSFNWTGIDPTTKLMNFLNPEIKDNPRIDPNQPKVVGW